MKKLHLLLLSFLISFSSFAQITDAALKAQSDVIRNAGVAANTKGRIAAMIDSVVNTKSSKYISRSFSSTLTFDNNFSMKTTQSANITFSLAGSGNVNDTQGYISIDGDASHSCTIPDQVVINNVFWNNTNGQTFDNIKNNQIYWHYINGNLNYSITKHAINAADVTPPVATFLPANSATGFGIASNLTITLNETIYTNAGVLIDNSNVASQIVLKQTNSSGSDVAKAATISGNVITLDPTSNLTNSTVYYYALIAGVKDAAGNATSLQSASFTTGAADVTPPTWTTNTVTSVGNTGATYTANINEAGSVYWMVTISATPPTTTAIQAGTGATAGNYGTLTMAAATNNTATFTGLTGGTAYYEYCYAVDGSGNATSVQTAISFTTTGGIIFSDTYTRANSASTMGNFETPSSTAWTTVKNPTGTSTWGIGPVANTAYCVTQSNSDGSYPDYYALGDAATTNVTVQADVYIPQGNTGYLIARYTDNANFLVFSFKGFGSSSLTIIISKVVSGTLTNIASGSYTTSVPGTFTVKLITSGSTVTAYVNGTLSLTATESILTGTKAGIGVLSGTGVVLGQMTFDNFTVR